MNLRGEDLGRIEEFVVDPERGRIEYAVLSSGEPFGAGEKFFAVPWEALHVDPARSDCVVDVEKVALDEGRGFDPEAWPTSPDRNTFPTRNTDDEDDPQKKGRDND